MLHVQDPFTESISISFKQTQSSFTSINIYSLSGRLLSQVYEGQLNQGIHEFRWKGEDENGNKLANGIYFCRYISNGNLKNIKVIKTE